MLYKSWLTSPQQSRNIANTFADVPIRRQYSPYEQLRAILPCCPCRDLPQRLQRSVDKYLFFKEIGWGITAYRKLGKDNKVNALYACSPGIFKDFFRISGKVADRRVYLRQSYLHILSLTLCSALRGLLSFPCR